jgi:hypothetical protein
MRPTRRAIPSFLIFILWCTPALLAQTAQPSDRWSDDVRELAGKIVAAAAPAHSVSISVKNLSSLNGDDVREIGDQLQAELTRKSFSVGSADSADVAITLTLSEGTEGSVWVAELHSLAGSRVVMIAPKPSLKSDDTERHPIVLSESRIDSSAEPVLDFSLFSDSDNRALLLILHTERVELLQRNVDSWVGLATAPIRHSRSWPRDIRGHIDVSSPGQFQIFLPGVQCTGSITSSLSMECRDVESAAWQVADPVKSIFIAPGRDYFATLSAAVNRQASDLPAFYSFAVDPTAGHAQAIEAGVDGDARLLSEKGVSVDLPVKWGDDVASLSASCSAGWYVLADATGDWTQPDRLQTFRVNSSSAIPAGHPLDLSGPVLALWPSNEGKSVRVVLRNLETGMYEASMVSASCSN